MTDHPEMKPFLDPIAFTVSLILAPIVSTLIFCWTLVAIPAVLFGAIPYLVFGTPVLLFMVTRYPVTFFRFALGGLCAQGLFAMFLITGAFFAPESGRGALGIDTHLASFMTLWGLPFAALWCGAFTWLYRKFYHSPVL